MTPPALAEGYGAAGPDAAGIGQEAQVGWRTYVNRV